MSVTIVRQTLSALPRNTFHNILTGFDTVLLDQAGWVTDETVAVDPSGLTPYRVTACISSQDSDISSGATIVLAALTETLSGATQTTVHRVSDRRAAGQSKPQIAISGLVLCSVNATAVGVQFWYGDTTTDRDWDLELQVESV